MTITPAAPASLIYLDYAAAGPVDPRVFEKMIPYLSWEAEGCGNASATHGFGLKARAAIEQAREAVAQLVNTDPKSIIWTSGATESNNLAIKGIAEFYKRQGRHIVTCQTEHRTVLDSCAYLVRQGFEVTYLKPKPDGLIELCDLEAALRKDTLLVSIMQINNETGVVQDIAAIGELTRSRGIFLHVDAAQSVGKIPIDLRRLPVDLMSFSAHKMYGPKGIGALYINHTPRVRLLPQLHGGGQEGGLRSGTLPTHQIVGMGEAFRIASDVMVEEAARLKKLGETFWLGIRDLPGVRLNGHPIFRVPWIVNVCFQTLEKTQLMNQLQALAISTASACSAATLETSHVLRSMGLRNELAHRSIRFSLGRYTTLEEIERAIAWVRQCYP